MSRWAVYTVGRTGSSLYCLLLANYLRSQDPDRDQLIYWQPGHDHPISWHSPIAHLHNLDHFLQAPDDFLRVITTRSILDSVISYMVALHTGHWHLFTAEQSQQYQHDYQDKKIRLEPDDFAEWARDQDRKYSRIFSQRDQQPNRYRQIDYQTHATDANLFYQALGIDHQLQGPMPAGAMTIDKFSLVENLAELLAIYDRLAIKNDFQDQQTIAQIQRKILA